MNGKFLLPCFLLLETHFKAEWQLQDHSLFLTHRDEKQVKKRTQVSLLPDMEISVQKAAKCWLPICWVGGERLKDSTPRHCEVAMVLQYCCYWLMSWDSQRLFNKVQSQEETYIPSPLRFSKDNDNLLVSCNWWLNIIWLREGLVSCVLSFLMMKKKRKKKQKRELD